MTRFCSNCGKPIREGARFCLGCGTAVIERTPVPTPSPAPVMAPTPSPVPVMAPTPSPAPVAASAPAPASSVAIPPSPITQTRENPAASAPVTQAGALDGVPSPGWSARANDPELLSRVDGKGLLSFKSLGRRMTGRGEDYEGTVIDKHTVREQYDPKDYGFERDRHKKRADYYTEYGITIIQTTTGKKQEIKEDLGGLNLPGPRVWDMLQVGDRVRYHTKFAFPYELYDKSRLSYLYCACCGAKNQIQEDRCKKCGAPLLK